MDIILGGTGLLGSELTFQLLRSGNKVCTVVRSTQRKPDVRRRQLESIAELHPEIKLTDDELQRLNVFAGDICQPNLQLNLATLQRLRAVRPRCLWNCAADVRYDTRFESKILNTNVDAIHHVIEFAETVSAGWLHHVSTAFISPVRCEIAFEEGLNQTAIVDARNLYEKSKILGELTLREKARIPWSIHRTAILIGPGSHGKLSNTVGYFGFVRGLFLLREILSKNDSSSGLFQSPFRIPGNPKLTMNLVPVDFTVHEMLAIQDLPDLRSGDVFHIVDGSPLTTSEHLELVKQCLDWNGLCWTDVSTETLNKVEKAFSNLVAGFQVQYCKTAPAHFNVSAHGRKPKAALDTNQLRSQVLSACEAWRANHRTLKIECHAIRKHLGI